MKSLNIAPLFFIISILLISSATPSQEHISPKIPIFKPPVTGSPTPTTYPPPVPGTVTKGKCPIDTVKLGACVDLLDGFLHIGLGDPVVNQCCPLIHGLVELEAAVCLCTTLRLKLINLNLYVPVALQLLLTCGKPPPPGFTCTL